MFYFRQKLITMKKYIFLQLTVALFAAVIFSCGTVRNTTPSRIGILPLESYQLTSGSLPGDTTYKVIRNEEEFRSGFSSGNAAARRPSFDGQMVVAILFKNPVSQPLQFQGAEVTGGTLTLYAVNCTGINCQPSQVVLATTPRVGNVTQARFVVNGEQKAIIRL